MLDSIAISAATTFVTEVFKNIFEDALKDKSKDVISKSSDSVWYWFSKKRKKYDIFNKGAESYVKQAYNRYNVVKVLGMREPIPLSDLYVSAYLYEKKYEYGFDENTILKYERSFQNSEVVLDFEDKEILDKIVFNKVRHDAISIINKLDKIILVGKPGCGKTTFVKYLALQSLTKNDKILDCKIPVIITLRDFINTNDSLTKIIISEFEICGFEKPDEFVLHMLEKGACLILIDGLDELPISNDTGKSQQQITKELNQLSIKYNLCKFVITCRTASYRSSWFESFTEIQISDFDNEQIKQFVNKYFLSRFSDRKDLAKKFSQDCLEQIFTKRELKEIVQTPILLVAVCLYYQRNKKLESKRADIYLEAIHILLQEWDSDRGIKRLRKYPSLSEKNEYKLLKVLAVHYFNKNKSIFESSDIIPLIDNYCFSQEINDIDGYELLRDMESVHGVILEVQKNVFSFAHLTIQEFLTAQYFKDNTASKSISHLISKTDDLRWKEVITFFCGIATETELKIFFNMFVSDIQLSGISDFLSIVYLVNDKINNTVPNLVVMMKYLIWVNNEIKANSFSSVMNLLEWMLVSTKQITYLNTPITSRFFKILPTFEDPDYIVQLEKSLIKIWILMESLSIADSESLAPILKREILNKITLLDNIEHFEETSNYLGCFNTGL